MAAQTFKNLKEADLKAICEANAATVGSYDSETKTLTKPDGTAIKVTFNRNRGRGKNYLDFGEAETFLFLKTLTDVADLWKKQAEKPTIGKDADAATNAVSWGNFFKTNPDVDPEKVKTAVDAGVLKAKAAIDKAKKKAEEAERKAKAKAAEKERKAKLSKAKKATIVMTIEELEAIVAARKAAEK